MEKYIDFPNLPQSPVTEVIMSGDRLEFIFEILNNYHINILSPSPLRNIDGAEKYHADMSVCHLGGNRFVIDEDNRELTEGIKSLGAEVTVCSGITAKNPKLNVCFLKNRVICNKDKTDRNISDFCAERDIEILHTKQSYSACSIAVVNENAVITADNSIYELCRVNKIDVLKIHEGYIRLDGYNYGFIGGCCGLIDKGLMVFSGDITRHPDYLNIKAFTDNYGVDIQSLGSNDLYDIGGILPVKEKI